MGKVTSTPITVILLYDMIRAFDRYGLSCIQTSDQKGGNMS